MLRVTDRPSATAALEQIRDGRTDSTDGAEDELPAALLSMIAACAVTAEGKQTIRGIGNERNGAKRAHSEKSIQYNSSPNYADSSSLSSV